MVWKIKRAASGVGTEEQADFSRKTQAGYLVELSQTGTDTGRAGCGVVGWRESDRSQNCGFAKLAEIKR